MERPMQILHCMAHGCEADFTASEIEKFLPATSIALLQKIKQEKEVDLADLPGLEKCPYVPASPGDENQKWRL